jgi:hypothetical protein
MTFNGIDNQTVELKITNYQYPDFNDGDWDGNWLNIYLNVKSKVGHWQTFDSSLTTWDVQRLINWFDSLSNNTQVDTKDIGFTEPNLAFELLDRFDKDNKTFRIKFDLESRPLSTQDDKEYFVDFIADNNELKRITSDLKKELDKYPERKPAHNSNLPKVRRSWWQKLFSSE